MGSFNLDELVAYLGFDYTRFALASAESLMVSDVEWRDHNLVGWPLLKLYYSAFFSAHALLRSQGVGFVKIERKQAKSINDLFHIIDKSGASFEPGMYIHALDTSVRGDPKLRFTKDSGGSGAHEGFWDMFCKYLNKAAEDAVDAGEIDANAFLTGATEITAAIRGGAAHAGSWMSTMRNEINYQHKHAVWFPVGRPQKSHAGRRSLRIAPANSITLPIGVGKDPVDAFWRVSFYLSLLNIDISEHIAARSTKGGAFGQKWRRLRNSLR